MFCYSGFALIIHSELELPGLAPGSGNPDVVIRSGTVPRTGRKATMEEEFAFNTHAGAFHIRQGREIIVDPLPGVDPDIVRVVLMGRIMAFLLRQRGWLPLHASGVAIAGQAVLFLGPSGSGKSTTAAAFHARGHQVITDDVGAVRVVGQDCLVRPAGVRIRLLEDSRSVVEASGVQGVAHWDKHSFDLGQGRLHELFPVRRIYVLEYGSGPGSEVIPPMAAVPLLSEHSFVKRWRMARESLDVHLRDCAAVANSGRVYRLTRLQSLRALPDLVRCVEGDIAHSE